jgi:hypothetical protein
VPYVQTVKTASGATAVRIVYSSHRGLGGAGGVIELVSRADADKSS